MRNRGNLMIDALFGLLIMSYCVGLVSLCIQSYYQVEKKQPELKKWQLEEVPCEIWCKELWIYDD